MEEFDIDQFARQMIREHGIHAGSEAAKWAAKMLEQQEYEGYRFWGRALATIEAIQNSAEL